MSQNESMMVIAKKEAALWCPKSRALVMAILFAFIHRCSTGKTVEEAFNFETAPDYEI